PVVEDSFPFFLGSQNTAVVFNLSRSVARMRRLAMTHGHNDGEWSEPSHKQKQGLHSKRVSLDGVLSNFSRRHHDIRQYMSYKIARCWGWFGMVIRRSSNPVAFPLISESRTQ